MDTDKGIVMLKRWGVVLLALALLLAGMWQLVQALDVPAPPPRATLVYREGQATGGGAYFRPPIAS